MVLQGSLACPWSSKWCCLSAWRLALNWWDSELGSGKAQREGQQCNHHVGDDSEHDTGVPHWQAHNIMLKGMTCLASDFEKCQKSVSRQCSSALLLLSQGPAVSKFQWQGEKPGGCTQSTGWARGPLESASPSGQLLCREDWGLAFNYHLPLWRELQFCGGCYYWTEKKSWKLILWHLLNCKYYILCTSGGLC